MDITEIQDELLRLEYPNLLPDHDPDIERYYYLRSIGQSRDALMIFQNRLIIRYPDSEFRTWLLRSYRSHDPVFRSLLAKGYRMLGARSLERVKQVLYIIAEKADSYNEKDVYSTIRAAEEILQFLSPERYEAVAGMERFLRYATVMEIKIKSIAKATELVRAYLTDTLSVVEEERRRRTDEKRRAEEESWKALVKADWDSYHYQKKYGVHIPFIDLSTVNFSQEDLARIEIPAFPRLEDQILGYCIKYWNNVNDPAFERILFLYSRKYGKKNYDVYMTIRRGQMAKRRDDEILSSIMSILVTGYYYSIQGDLYLQRNWNAIKFALTNQGQAQSQPSTKALPAPAETAKKKPEKGKTEKKLPAQSKPEPEQINAKKSEVKSKKAKVKRSKAKRTVKILKKQKSAKKAEILSRIAPKPKAKAVPKIAPKPAKVTRPAAVVAWQAGTSTTGQTRIKQVKVPNKLKPAEQIKTTIIPRPAPQPKPAAAPVQRMPVQPKSAPIQPAAAKPSPVPKAPVQPAVVKPPVATPPPAKPAAVPVQRIPVQPTPAPIQPAAVKPPVVTPPPAKPAAISQTKPKTAALTPPAYRPAPYVPASPPKEPPKPKVFSNKTLGKAKGSVSDRLKELSGRSYDVYEDRFLSKARSSIRKVLGTGRGLFFTLPEEAEDMVYNFLRDHYSDPYMDWESSADRKSLMAMGFDLPSINPVIDECYKNL